MLTGGWLGVDLFFALSGFLIGRILISRLDGFTLTSFPKGSLRAFGKSRVSRLIPGLMLFLVIWGAASFFFPIEREAFPGFVNPDIRWTVLAVFSGLINWITVVGGPVPHSFGHLWSLAVEWQLYVVAPVVALFIARCRLTTRRSLLLLVLVFMVLLYGFAPWLGMMTGEPAFVYAATFTRAIGFFAGFAGAVALHARITGPVFRLPASRRRPLIVVVLLALIYHWAVASQQNLADMMWMMPTAAVLSGMLVWLVAQEQIVLTNRVGRLWLWFGRRSYAAYLYNWPLTFLITRTWDFSWWLTAVVCWTATWIFAGLSWTLVEQRFQWRTTTDGSGE